MEITRKENALIMKYLETKDESILDHVIEHPWAYSVDMIRAVITLQCINLTPRRIVCLNSLASK